MARLNGFQRPFDPLQVFSWFLFSFLAATFYAFLTPILGAARVGCSVVYGVLGLCVVSLTVLGTYRNPADPALLPKSAKSNASAGTGTGADEQKLTCGICRAQVCMSAKHCRACDKCVSGFDHHCKWLNNCIGDRNYKVFMALMASALSLVSLQLAVCVYAVVLYVQDAPAWLDRARNASGFAVSAEAHLAVVGINCTLLAPTVLLLGQLLGFHFLLISRRQTTYEYLVAQRATAAPPDQPSGYTRTSARGLASACWGRCVCGGEARRTKVDPMAAAAAAAEGAHSSESGGARAEAAAETAARRADGTAESDAPAWSAVPPRTISAAELQGVAAADDALALTMHSVKSDDMLEPSPRTIDSDSSAAVAEADGAIAAAAVGAIRAQADLRGRASPDLSKRAKPRGLPELEKPVVSGGHRLPDRAVVS